MKVTTDKIAEFMVSQLEPKKTPEQIAEMKSKKDAFLKEYEAKKLINITSMSDEDLLNFKM